MNRQDERVQMLVYKISKLHVIRTDDQSKREQVASFDLRSQCHQIWSLVHSQYGSAGYTKRKICHKTYLQHSETSIAVIHKSNQMIIHHKNIAPIQLIQNVCIQIICENSHSSIHQALTKVLNRSNSEIQSTNAIGKYRQTVCLN